MVAVALVAVLAVAGVVTFLVLRSRSSVSEDFVDVSSRLQGTGATPAAASQRQPGASSPTPREIRAAPVTPPVTPASAGSAGSALTPAPSPAALTTTSRHEEEGEEPVVDRFRAPGERARRSSPGYQPTVPRKPVHLLESSGPLVPEPSRPVDPAGDPFESRPAVAPADAAVAPADAAVAPADAAVAPADAAAAVDPGIAPAVAPKLDAAPEPEPEPEPVPEPEPEPVPEPVPEPEPEPEPVIVLDDPAPVVVLDEEATGRAAPSEAVDDDVDEVLQALIQRLGVSEQDAAEVAAELVERPDIDEGEVVDALSDLVERSERDRSAETVEELVLFSDQVPQRPGQLTHFADLPDLERRRVIVRVLCLLVARSEDQLARERASAPISSDRVDPRPARSWPLPVTDAPDDDLPARRRLARARR